MKKIPKLIIAAYIFLVSGIATAESKEEQLIRQSFFSISAFECAVLSNNDEDHKRLFNLGIENGREFIAAMKSSPETYQKTRNKVAMLLILYGGPTTDFTLGRIYSDRESEIYKKFDMNEDLWKSIKSRMFLEKNCAFIKQGLIKSLKLV